MTRTKKMWLIVVSCAAVLAVTGVLLWCFVFNRPPRRLTLEFDADRVAAIYYGEDRTVHPITDPKRAAFIAECMNGEEFVWIGELTDEYAGCPPAETQLLDENGNAVWTGGIQDRYTIHIGTQIYRALGDGINVNQLQEAAGLS